MWADELDLLVDLILNLWALVGFWLVCQMRDSEYWDATESEVIIDMTKFWRIALYAFVYLSGVVCAIDIVVKLWD